uniref:11S seed storage globulin n=1 Tax=Chenopodium quinoa TaxID=63459 RepID=Q6Q385_CHEQI|nr:11S seed storage globulin [Chenopodium quinoa]
MAKSTTTLFLLSCSIALVLLNGCMGQGRMREMQGNECQIDRLTALEPTNRIQAEGGLTEVWDTQDQQFQCSGVSVIRRTIEPNGLLLPSFTSGPELIYIEQGNGISGLMIPGCPETFESMSQESWREGMKRGMRGGRFQDQHQKIRHLRQGHIFAMPAGVAHWAYNTGNEPLVAVILIDTSNHANQLDKDYPKRFYLAGKPQQEHSRHQHRGGESQRGERGSGGNVFSGLGTKTIAQSFGVSEDIAEKLQAEQDERGNIVLVQEGLHVIKPPSSRSYDDEREQRRHRSPRSNGLEETICSARLSENIDEPSKADVYSPEAGRLTTLNSFNLPILSNLRLSAEKGVLYRNAIMAPHYNLNAHSIIYGVRGRGRIQIVNAQGNSVFDDELRQGQLVVVPQNFAVVKQAGEEGFEWIAFKTCENALFQTLAGRTSAIRAMPLEVISNIYQISREQAYRLKFSRSETTLFRPENQGRQRRDLAA